MKRAFILCNFKIFFSFFLVLTIPSWAEINSESQIKSETAETPEKIHVKPHTRDKEIAQRLQNIYTATRWFTNTEVTVKEGVVFLSGQTTKDEYKVWAGNVARKTEDVAAVVNRIDVIPSIWDYGQAIEGVRLLWRKMIQALPSIIFSLAIFIITYIIARLSAQLARMFFRQRIASPVLKELAAKAIGFIVFLLGAYIVFELAGLTTIAFTFLGGTGILGIILGIAFRDITENILASIFLSMQQPFRNGDLIEVEETIGYVQRLTLRATILLSLEGNHIQIPNAKVYKGKIRNYTSNIKRREDFVIGIGYDVAIAVAQDFALKVLSEHPAVLKAPEPWVLVDSLGKATVNLRIYFWLNGDENSWLKVRSSVMRLIKKTFQEQSISMPDLEREIIFPKGVPVQMISEGEGEKKPFEREQPESGEVSTKGESGLGSPAREIQAGASQGWMPEEGENLLT